ncbi:MAG: site-specific integrase [bacterium]|nr:site-specific integrase [bacterium]
MTALSQKGSLLAKFETFLSSERKVSNKTLRNYRSDLNNFLKWCRHYFLPSGVFIRQTEDLIPFLTPSLVTLYKGSQAKGLVPVATINRRLSTLRNFAEFLMFEGLLEKNPLETILNMKRLTSITEPAPVYATADGWHRRDEPIAGLPADLSAKASASVEAPAKEGPVPVPLPPKMPKELTTPYRVKGADSLFLHRVKITAAAVSGFGSVFVLLFIAKSIFGDALIFGPGAINNQEQKFAEVETPLLTTTLSFGDLLAQTPAVLGASTQKTSEQGTATLSANSREIALYSPNLGVNSQITVIPENSIESAIFVAQVSEAYFTVAVDRPTSSDIPFEWEISGP